MMKMILVGMFTMSAWATITPNLVTGPNTTAPFCTPVAGGCEYSYTATVGSGYTISTGSYFTIYDFAGLVFNGQGEPLVSQPEGWEF